MGLLAVSVMSGVCACAAMAQRPDIPFKPGEWKVNVTVVVNNGKSMTNQRQVCMGNPEETLQQKRPGQSCDPVKFTQASGGGVQIQMHCKSGSGQVMMEMNTDMMTHFSSNGESYTESGTSTSSTTMPGRPPMVMKIQIQGSGTRVGSCTPKSNP